MNESSLRRSLASAAVVAALVLHGGVADAVVYSSAFDPPDFEGVALFDVSQACLSHGDGSRNNGEIFGDSTVCTVTWLDADVTFKDPNPLPPDQSEQLDFAPPLPSPSAVTDIFVQGGELVGVNSIPIGPVIVSGSPVSDFNGPWWIE